MARVITQPKPASDTIKVTFNFLSQMAVGETIVTASCIATVYTGVDASPSSIISGVSSISGQTVTQALTGGIAGVVYQVVCTITTSTGQTLTQSTYLYVESNLP
jgi:flagellar biosynthesis protein FliR